MFFPKIPYFALLFLVCFSQIFAGGAWGRKKGSMYFSLTGYSLQTNQFYGSDGKKETRKNLHKNVASVYNEVGLPQNWVLAGDISFVIQEIAQNNARRGLSDLNISLQRPFKTPWVHTGAGIQLSIPWAYYRQGDSTSLGDGEADLKYSLYIAKKIPWQKMSFQGEIFHRQRFEGYTPEWGYTAGIYWPAFSWVHLGLNIRGQDLWGSANSAKILPYTGLGEAVVFHSQGARIYFPLMGGQHFILGYQTSLLGENQNIYATGIFSLGMGVSY